MTTHKLKINPCKKCGADEHTIDYKPSEHETHKSFSCEEIRELIKKEHINVECSVCGYSWKVEPLEKEVVDD